MTRAVRLSAALLLAVVGLIGLPSAGWAQNSPWEYSAKINPLNDEPLASVISLSLEKIGAYISFSCAPGNPIEKFTVLAATRKSDVHSEPITDIAWRVDKDELRQENWRVQRDYGVGLVGKPAYEFALAAMGAKERVVFTNSNGIIVFNAKNSTKAISQLLEFCRLPQ